MKQRINLLEGNIFTSLTMLAMPIMATSLIQMAYNMTDMIWVGRMGSGPLAAIGVAGMYLWLSNGFSTLARMGGQVKLAHAMGSEDYKLATQYAQNALQLGLLLAFLFSITMILFTKPLIGFFKLTDAQSIAQAEIYLKIAGGGIIFSFMNQIMTGLLTATGNSKTPFVATTLGLVINIVLDPMLIFGFWIFPSMGVMGAAIATVFAQAIVFIVFVLYAIKEDLVFGNIKLLAKPNKECIKEIVRIGLPSAVQSTMFTAISMVISRLVAGFGDAAIAVQKVGTQIESISWMFAEGFAVAISAFVAQNFGAKNIKRAKKGVHTSFIAMAIWGLVSTAILILLAEPIFKIFITEADVVPLGVDYLLVLGLSQFFLCIEITAGGVYAGFGNTITPSAIGIIFTAARIPLAMLLHSTALGLNGIWWSITISTAVKGVLLFVLLHFYMKKIIHVRIELN